MCFVGGLLSRNGTPPRPSICLTRSADIPVRSNVLRPAARRSRALLAFRRCCGQGCPRSAKQIAAPITDHQAPFTTPLAPLLLRTFALNRAPRPWWTPLHRDMHIGEQPQRPRSTAAGSPRLSAPGPARSRRRFISDRLRWRGWSPGRTMPCLTQNHGVSTGVQGLLFRCCRRAPMDAGHLPAAS
jgi:hypothetical protein